ncbi:hypothetical protein P9112_005692 [Eukaryota sp. TZLM1-RC]
MGQESSRPSETVEDIITVSSRATVIDEYHERVASLPLPRVLLDPTSDRPLKSISKPSTVALSPAIQSILNDHYQRTCEIITTQQLISDPILKISNTLSHQQRLFVKKTTELNDFNFDTFITNSLSEICTQLNSVLALTDRCHALLENLCARRIESFDTFCTRLVENLP